MCIDYIPEITSGRTKQTGEQKALSCVYIQGWGGCYSFGIMRLFFFLSGINEYSKVEKVQMLLQRSQKIT